MKWMISNTVLLLCLLGVFLQSCHSAPPDRIKAVEGDSLDYFINGKYEILEVDNLGNFFLVDQDNIISKYNANGKLLFEFSLNRLGDISSVDVSNPQKLLVYYGDYNYIVFLDNTLSEISRLNLNEYNYWNVTAVSISREANMWIYDPVENQIMKVDENGNALLSSNELYFTIDEKITRPALFEFERYLYLGGGKMLYQFDNFGQFIRSFDISSDELQYFPDKIAWLENDQLFVRSLLVSMVDEKTRILEYQGIIDFHIAGKKLYILDPHGLKVISI